VLEVLVPAVPLGRNNPTQPIPRQQCRIGFSKGGSSLYLGESADSFCFDADGTFITNKAKNPCAERFARDNVVGVLLNLDPSSPNANTVSLFKDGKRASKPQPIPEALKGEALFPHVSFRNVTMQLNFGPEPMTPLPFKCRMIQNAAEADAEVMPAAMPVEGKYEVVFPIALPDEGTFDWLEDFLLKNPGYVELSDRKIIEWAVNSGLGKPRTTSLKNCNDKPDVTFGIQAIDELTPRKLLQLVASLMPRNYVVMEVKSNLIKAERQVSLARFNFPHFKKTAAIIVGEPSDSFKAKVHSIILAEKQEKLDAEWKIQQAEKERKKQIELKQKQLAEQRAKFEAQRKAMEEAAKAKEKAEAGEDEGKEEVDAKEEVKEEVKEEKPEEKEDVEMKEEPEEPPKAQLDEEEQKLWFLPKPTTDMVSSVFNSTFADFSLPSVDEDFNEIRYEWASEVTAIEYMRSWMQAKKITTRIEDLVPSEWFLSRTMEWQRLSQEWQGKQKEFKQDPVRRQAALVRMQKEKLYHEKMEKAQAAADGKEVEVKKEEEPLAAPEGEETEEQKEKAAAAAEAATAMEDDTSFIPVDINTVEDVCDISDGEPLFADFTFEDWAMLNIRFELLLLCHAFKKDVTDPERPGVHETHLGYYYNRYFRKPLNIKNFGVDSNTELVALVKESVNVKDSILHPELTEEQLANADILVRVQEESRRDRVKRVEAGDESAKLKFLQVGTIGTTATGKAAMPTPKGFAAPAAWNQWDQAARPAWGKGFVPQAFKGAMGKGAWGPGFGMGKGW